MISKEIIDEYFSYEKSKGVFIWKKKSGRNTKIGKIAGCKNPNNGYVKIGFLGKTYYLHHLVWFYENGEFPEEGYVIDHIDGDDGNNRISNLRLCYQSENICNSKLRKTSKTGVKGVWWNKRIKKWMVEICANGKKRTKTFFELEEARRYASKLRQEMHGKFAREF